MPRQRVLIAGAGIAGLTAALTLARRGFEVKIFERAPILSEIGAGIQLSPNCGRILADLGLDDALAVAAIEPRAIDVRSGTSGHRIVSIPLGRRAEKRHGGPYRVLHRADLQGVLRAAVQKTRGITLRLGEPVRAVETIRDGVAVTIGQDVEEGDLLIGADGLRSTVRSAVKSANAPHPAGRTAWRATIAAGAAGDLIPSDRTVLFLGPSAHLVAYPISAGTEVNLVAIIEDRLPGGGWDEWGDPAVLARAFAGWAEPIRDFVEFPSWRRFALNEVDPTGSWVDGRVALIGDAAHAMLPFLAQGAAMAIEDAAVLAATLSAMPDAIEDALVRYQALRAPRVTRVWRAARSNGKVYHLGRAAAFIRDAGMVALGGGALLAQYDWLYGWKLPEPA